MDSLACMLKGRLFLEKPVRITSGASYLNHDEPSYSITFSSIGPNAPNQRDIPGFVSTRLQLIFSVEHHVSPLRVTSMLKRNRRVRKKPRLRSARSKRPQQTNVGSLLSSGSLSAIPGYRNLHPIPRTTSQSHTPPQHGPRGSPRLGDPSHTKPAIEPLSRVCHFRKRSTYPPRPEASIWANGASLASLLRSSSLEREMILGGASRRERRCGASDRIRLASLGASAVLFASNEERKCNLCRVLAIASFPSLVPRRPVDPKERPLITS